MNSLTKLILNANLNLIKSMMRYYNIQNILNSGSKNGIGNSETH